MHTVKKHLAISMLSILYLCMFYATYHFYIRADFTSFYAAFLKYKDFCTPYNALYSYFAPLKNALAVNLTPPIFLELFQWLADLPFALASVVWLLVSIILGVATTLIIANIVVAKADRKAYQSWLVLIYLALFSTFQNNAIGQLGSLLFFLIIFGYYFYLKNQDIGAGVCWGLIIAIKLFPGLLLFFILKNKRYQLLAITIMVFCLAWIIPLLTHGGEIYLQYFKLINKVAWYADNWNASFLGFFYRFIDRTYLAPYVFSLKVIFYIVFTLSLGFFLFKLYSPRKTALPHYDFCLTLMMMLFMSPLGWLYYFSILILPMLILYQYLFIEHHPNWKTFLCWCGSFILLNFPQEYREVYGQVGLYTIFGLNSFYFFGLLSLLFLLCNASQLVKVGPNAIEHDYHIPVILLIMVLFGLCLPIFQLFCTTVINL